MFLMAAKLHIFRENLRIFAAVRFFYMSYEDLP